MRSRSAVRSANRRARAVFSVALGAPDWRLRANALFMLGGILGGFVALATLFPEGWWQDRRFASGGGGSFSEEVVLIALDEHFAERYDRPDPTPRDYLARILNAAATYEPTAIAIDFRIGPTAEADTAFAALREAARLAAERGVSVVLPATASWPEPEVVLAPPPSLAGAAVSGLVTSPTAHFGEAGEPELRALYPLQKMRDGRLAPSFALAAVAAHRCGAAPAGVPSPRGVMPHVGDDEAARLLECAGLPARRTTTPVLLDYAGPPSRAGSLAIYSSDDFLEAAEAGRFEASWIAGRIVVVAATYATDYDVVRTPFGVARGGWFHVYAIDTLLRGAGRQPVNRLFAGVLALILLVGLLSAWMGPGWRALVITSIVLMGYVLLAFIVYGASGVMMPVAFPLYVGLGGATFGYLFHDTLRRDPEVAPADVAVAEARATVPG